MHVDGCLVRDKCICALGRCRDDAAIRAPAGSSGWSEVQLLTSILTELKRRDEAFAVTLLAITCALSGLKCAESIGRARLLTSWMKRAEWPMASLLRTSES